MVWHSSNPGQAPALASELAKSYEALTKSYSLDAAKHYNRGVELHQLGQIDEAISEYDLATRADSRFIEAWSNLGSIYFQEKHSYAQAINAFKKALAISEEVAPSGSSTAHCLVGLADVYRAEEKYDEAEPLYKRAIAIEEKDKGPSYAHTLDGYAALLLKTKRPTEAAEVEAKYNSIRAEKK